jgi:hypothetical protein
MSNMPPLPHWDVLKDMVGPISQAWVVWDLIVHAPLVLNAFDDLMAQLRSNTPSTNKFICSTLVW